jgi:hypothetical protein
MSCIHVLVVSRLDESGIDNRYRKLETVLLLYIQLNVDKMGPG